MAITEDNATGHLTSETTLLIDAREAAASLGISDRKLWSLTNSGEIPVVRVGRRVLYEPDDLRQWIASKKTGGSQ